MGRFLRLAALTACLLGLGCRQRAASPQGERIAILRFENLSMDSSSDWMGRAFSEIVSAELTGVPGVDPIPSNRMHALNSTLGVRPISVPGISSERAMALASGATRIAYGSYAVRGGRLDAQLTIEDPRTNKMVEMLTASAGAGDISGAASELAHQISRQAQPFGTRNANAVKAWATALESTDGAALGQSLEAAIAADPDFAPPYRLLAQWRAQRQDRAGALSLLDQALARGDKIAPIERARIELESANLREDSAGREKALTALVKLDSQDPNAWRSLGDGAFGRRDFAVAKQAYQKAVELEPENASGWNQLGYTFAYSGDLNGALGALHHYQTLRPNASDPLDSQGDVYLLLGRLREAEDFYLQAAKKSPGYPNAPDLFKAAMARLLTGDVAGADGIARQYIEGRRASHDPAADLFGAEWVWTTGQRKAALAKLTELAQSTQIPQLASGAYAELALWNLVLGDRPAAEQAIRKAVPPAGKPTTALVVLAAFLLQPPANAAEWAARAERAFPPASRDTAVAYALVLQSDFAGAEPVLKRVMERAGPAADDSTRILLAWCRMETGHVEDAAPLLKLNPVPPLTGPGPLVSIYFPRIFHLRALEAQKAGRTDEARVQDRMFVQLSGPDPLLWGEEKKAQAGQ